MTDTPDLHDAQSAIAEAFTDHDMTRLAAMTAKGRAKQVAARRAVYEHIDAIWEAPKQASEGRDHPVDLGGYEGVAAMRDLLMDLIGNGEQAQANAEDDVEGD